MNLSLSNQPFKKILFWITFVLIAIHISICSVYIFYNIDFLPSRLASIYKKLLVPGPFYADDRITTSPHLYISHSSPIGNWLPFKDVSQTNLLTFQNGPWRLSQIKMANYHRYIGQKAYEEIQGLKYIDGSEGWASQELIQYGTQLKRPESDSVRFLLLWKTWIPSKEVVKIDTAFYVIFKMKKE